MGQIFAGLGFAALFLAIGILLIWKKKAPRVAAWSMFLAGCGLVGSFFGNLFVSIAAKIPGEIIVIAAVICAGGFFIDCWGKQNKAGKVTAILGLVAPLLIVAAPISLFGVAPGSLIQEVNSVTRDSGVVRAGVR